MAKKIIKKLLDKAATNQDVIKSHRSLRFFGDRLFQPNLWHLSRRSASLAFAIGIFCAWIPLPTQMLISAGLSVYFGSNLPLSVLLVWIGNPITIAPMFYIAYTVGSLFLNEHGIGGNFAFSLDNLINSLGYTWKPFLLGSFVLGLSSSLLGYFSVQYFWRLHTTKMVKKTI